MPLTSIVDHYVDPSILCLCQRQSLLPSCAESNITEDEMKIGIRFSFRLSLHSIDVNEDNFAALLAESINDSGSKPIGPAFELLSAFVNKMRRRGKPVTITTRASEGGI